MIMNNPVEEIETDEKYGEGHTTVPMEHRKS